MPRLRVVFAPLTFAAGLLAASCSSRSAGTVDKDVADAGSGGDVSTAPAAGPSCMASGAGLTDCGGTGGDSCCSSAPLPAGTFFRSYIADVTMAGTSTDYPATVSAVSLDRYEVTVARFRAFVAAEVGGWRPAAGSGKHSELPQGGLNGGAETGWDSSWNANLATTTAEWSTDLACDLSGQQFATWTGTAGENEDHPINCVDWYDAYAFCIWDGGFLPSEAEWNYAAAGGSDQRAYPWSSPSSSTTLDCAHADYTACTPAGTTKVGAESPVGDGKWGHSDLAGNVFEWNLDWDATYATSCDDCANLTASQYRVIRGGAFEGEQVCLLNPLRETSVPGGRSASIGFRCARP